MTHQNAYKKPGQTIHKEQPAIDSTTSKLLMNDTDSYIYRFSIPTNLYTRQALKVVEEPVVVARYKHMTRQVLATTAASSMKILPVLVHGGVQYHRLLIRTQVEQYQGITFNLNTHQPNNIGEWTRGYVQRSLSYHYLIPDVGLQSTSHYNHPLKEEATCLHNFRYWRLDEDGL